MPEDVINYYYYYYILKYWWVEMHIWVLFTPKNHCQDWV